MVRIQGELLALDGVQELNKGILDGKKFPIEGCILVLCCPEGTAEECQELPLVIRVGPLRRNFFFQNAHSSGLATDVESKIPPNQTDIGPHKKLHQG